MEYCSSRLTSVRGTARGAVKPDIDKAVAGAGEQEDENEEGRLGQTVDVPAEAVEQVESLNSFFCGLNFILYSDFRSKWSCRKEGIGGEPQIPAPLTSGKNSHHHCIGNLQKP